MATSVDAPTNGAAPDGAVPGGVMLMQLESAHIPMYLLSIA